MIQFAMPNELVTRVQSKPNTIGVDIQTLLIHIVAKDVHPSYVNVLESAQQRT